MHEETLKGMGPSMPNKPMSLEIEKKYRIDAAISESIVQMLDEIGALFEGEDHEENIIYSGGSLSSELSVLRLRIVGETTTITYKRRFPSQEDIKQQIEFETCVENAEAMNDILIALGFVPALIYEKRRKKWRFGEVEIVVDQLPFGMFIEIEGPVENIRLAEKSLGIETLECVHETYPELTARHGKPTDGLIEARFS